MMKAPRLVPRTRYRAAVVEEPDIIVAEAASTAAPESLEDALRLLIRWTLRSMGRDPTNAVAPDASMLEPHDPGEST